jgi:hypothetical protein
MLILGHALRRKLRIRADAIIWLLAQPAKQKQLKLIVSVFWYMDGLPRFDGPVLTSDMRILGPPLTPRTQWPLWLIRVVLIT